jgi:dTDP-4-amino-4,6-dideoxygalactose transaminase
MLKSKPPVNKVASPQRVSPPHATQVPLLDLQRQYAQIRDEVLQALERVMDSQRFILGEEVAAFERETSAFIGAAETIACASGSDALWLMLVACGVEAGDEVLTTPFSFFASASSIVHAGARPIFVDIDPATFNLDPAKVDARLRQMRSTHLKAILPVHLYGQCAEMDEFRRIAQEFKVSLVEDAAQAFGAAWRGARAGSLGAAAAFSFYPTKNLSAAGDAGCITTQDRAVADQLRSLRNHGGRERYHHDEMGWNSRLDALQAAILRVKMRHIESWNARRRDHAAEYERLFAASGLAAAPIADPKDASRQPASPDIAGAAPVVLPHTAAEASHIFHQYVIRAQRRDDLRTFLTERGVGTEVYYPTPLHLLQPLLYLGYAQGDFPEAERACQEVLALPIFPELTPDEQAYVVETVAEFYS